MADPATKKKTSVPPDKMVLYEKLLASVEGIESKSNFGSGYTAVNGNMYSMISKYGVVGIRLPDDEREAFIKRHKTEMFRGDPSWPPSKELVAVPDALLRNTEKLRPYMELSFRYAQGLKPKPTKRTAPAKRVAPAKGGG